MKSSLHRLPLFVWCVLGLGCDSTHGAPASTGLLASSAIPESTLTQGANGARPKSSTVLGRFARLCGKVNNHQSPGGAWTPDPDCHSGCNIGGLAYCQKFWPATTAIREVAISSKPNNVWTTAGCGPYIEDFDGHSEFECLTDARPTDVRPTVAMTSVPLQGR